MSNDIHISKELVKFIKVLHKAADYAESHGGKLTKQLQTTLRKAGNVLLEALNKPSLILDLAFYERIDDFLEEIVFLRTLFAKYNLRNEQLLKDFADVVTGVYALVYSSEVVQEICISNQHIAKKLSRFTTIGATEQLIGTMFHKIILLEEAANVAERRMERLTNELEKAHKGQKKDKLEKLKEEFVSVTFASYALNAAVELALEELGVIKEHFRKLLRR